MYQLPLALLNNLGGPDLLIIGLVALLIFGRRIPEIGKNLGRSIVQFKKGLQDQDEKIPKPRKDFSDIDLPKLAIYLLAVLLALLIIYYFATHHR